LSKGFAGGIRLHKAGFFVPEYGSDLGSGLSLLHYSKDGAISCIPKLLETPGLKFGLKLEVWAKDDTQQKMEKSVVMDAIHTHNENEDPTDQLCPCW
jgi:hypothetical protein